MSIGSMSSSVYSLFRAVSCFLGSHWVSVLSVGAMTGLAGLLLLFVVRHDIRKKIAARQARREASFRELEKQLKGRGGVLLTPTRLEIRKLSFSELQGKLQGGSLKAVDVLDSYTACALAVAGETNCVVEFVHEAREWAAALDDLGPGKGGPLHGIPVSMKENFGLVGYDSTYGTGKRLGMPWKNDAVVVAVLKNLGAVPFCRTNVPQPVLSFACANPVYGCSENAYQKGRTTGGSSGGEACLIGAGGSLFGLGSDIGGSLRIPAAFSGCFSLKPTVGRLSAVGMHEAFKELCGMSPTAGFLARGTDALEFVFREVTRSELHRKIDLCQPDLKPVQAEELRPLVVGFCDDDGYFPPTPGIRRAVAVAKEVLARRGHRLVPFRIPDADVAFPLYLDLVKADGMKQLREAMEGEPVDSSMMLNTIATRIPPLICRLLAPLAAFVSPKTASALAGGARRSADLWTTVHQSMEYRRNFVDGMREAGIDVLLCPSLGVPAPPHELCSFLQGACSYTTLFNLTDLPAGIVPVTFENREDQLKLLEYPTGGDRMYSFAKNGTKGATGLPLAVQIAGYPFDESSVLLAMKELEAGLRESFGETYWLHSLEPWRFASSEFKLFRA